MSLVDSQRLLQSLVQDAGDRLNLLLNGFHWEQLDPFQLKFPLLVRLLLLHRRRR